MIEKILKVINLNRDEETVPYIEYLKSFPSSNFPTFMARMNYKKYNVESLKDNITDSLETEIIEKLIAKAEKIKGPLLDLNELLEMADLKIYDTTKRVIANTVVCNSSMEESIKNVTHKNIIICESIPEQYILCIHFPNDSISWPAILAKGKEKYLLDIINPELFKVVDIDNTLVMPAIPKK